MKPSDQWRLFADALERRGEDLHLMAKQSGSDVIRAAALALGGASCDATAVAAELALEEARLTLAEFVESDASRRS